MQNMSLDGEQKQTCELENQERVSIFCRRSHQTDRYHWCRGIYQTLKEFQTAIVVPQLRLLHAQHLTSGTPVYFLIPAAAVARPHSQHLIQVAKVGQGMQQDLLLQRPNHFSLQNPRQLSQPRFWTLGTISVTVENSSLSFSFSMRKYIKQIMFIHLHLDHQEKSNQHQR